MPLPFEQIFGQASPDQVFGTGSSSLPSGGAPPPGDIASSLMGGFGAPVDITQKDIQAAISPISGRGPQGIPSYFTTPHAQILPPAEMDRREVIGAGNARAQGIGNAVSAVTRLTGNIIAQKKLQKQEADATKVQRLLEAQAGIDQAQSILKQDPNNAEAKQSLQDNQRLVQGMFQDPKFVKTLEKGFQVSLTDPSQNKTDDHNIVQKGIDLFKKKSNQSFSPEQAQGAMQKFQASLPKQLMPNQMAMQQLQTKMAVRKDQMMLMRSVLPALLREEASAKRLEYTQQHADYRAMVREQGENGRKWADILSRTDLQNLRANQARGLAYLHAGLQLRNAEAILADKGQDPAKILTERDRFDKEMTASEQAQQRLTLALTQDRDVYQHGKGVDNSVLQDKNRKIYEAEQTLKEMRESHSVGMQQFSDRITGKVNLDGSSSGAGSDNGGTSREGVAAGLLGADDLSDVYRTLGLENTEDEPPQ